MRTANAWPHLPHLPYLPLMIVCAVFAGGCVSAHAALRLVVPLDPAAADSGDGAPGHPYRTLHYAMTQLMPGDTLIIAAGVYRDALIFPARRWSLRTPTLIAGSGAVTILGNDVVNGWHRQADGVFVKTRWMQQPQQVLLNGLPLKQVGGTIFDGYPERAGHPLAGLHRTQGGIWPARLAATRAAMPAESFLYDAAHHALLIRTSTAALPDGAVQVSTRPYLVLGRDVAGVTVRGIRFRYSNTTTLSRQGAITLSGHGNRLQRLTIEDMDGAGIEMAGDDNSIADCTVMRSGYLGIKARGRRNRIVGNRVSANNTRGFNKWWEAGGMKFIGNGGLRDSTVAGNRVDHNHGDGIWFDWGNDANLVRRNVAAYNDGFGIHYEASTRARILDNRVFGNRQRGIYLPHSRNSLVAHNLVVANGLDGIAIVDEARTDPDGKLDLRPRGNTVRANLLAWNQGAAVILPGAGYGNRSDANLFLQAGHALYFSMGWPAGPADRENLDQWRAAHAQDRRSAAVVAAPDRRLAQALQREQMAPDWSKLMAYQSTLEHTLSGKVGPR